MFKCIIEISGLPYNAINLREVEIELQDGNTLEDVIVTLKNKFPALEGTVVKKNENRLAEFYKFNVNGRFYYDQIDVEIKEGDHITLLNLVTGG